MGRKKEKATINEDLVRAIQQEQDPYKREQLENQLFKLNMGFCYHIAHKYRTASLNEVEDFFGLAQIGFMKAVKGFNPDRGVQFISYAGQCMHNMIRMELRSARRRIRTLSLYDGPLGEDGETLPYMDMVEAEAPHTLESAEWRMVMTEVMTLATQVLNPKELFMLQNALEPEPLTHKEIAELFGHSQSYTSRILQRAYQKIRNHLKQEDIMGKIVYNGYVEVDTSTKTG